MKTIQSKQFRFTLSQVVEIARIYALNGKSISRTFSVCAHSGLSFDAFQDVDDTVFLVELIEDIDRISNRWIPRGPLNFSGKLNWTEEILRALAS